MKTKTFTTSQVNTSVGIDFKEKSKKSTTFTNFHRHPSATSKFGWLKGQRYLILLHKILYKYGLIDCRSHNRGEKSELPVLVETYTETWGKMFKSIIIKKYDNDGEATYPINPVFADLIKNEKSKPEVVKSTEEDHLNACSESSRNVYNEIKEALLKADSNIEFNAKKIYISVRKNKNLAFFHLRKKISLVVMSKEDYTRTQIKHHEIKSLPASVQKFWNGACCTIVIENSNNLNEVIALLKMMIAKS